MIRPILIFYFFLYPSILLSQIFSESDVEICNAKFELAVEKNLAEKPIGDVIAEVGKSFIGTDYLSYGLEKDGDEQLVINLTGLDCTTFLENSLVLARCIKTSKISFEDYLNNLQFIRYRNGVIDQYPSRLHYFSDWIYANAKKGIVEDVTEEIGGQKIKFKLDFMSTHPDSYKHLRENPDFIPIIKKQEKEISCREYYFIPKEDLNSKEEFIQNGDLLAITTTVEGLDIGHIGIAVKMDDGRIHLLHAPTENTEVQITEQPLSDYLMKYKRHSGVIVLRALEN
ncbi:MAG TPA: N-acetylmuramoyl-L-alanine amidase-like domain-containing protein [Ignavibacteriaceae bacterium]|nr:N-acetylmuramoyl-L-alanine amidase-like domain-containing protein [Ignavibacteriaceae bacterium]